MKAITHPKIYLLALLLLHCLSVAGQQFTVPQHFIFNPHLYNPASNGAKGYHEAFIGGGIRNFNDVISPISHTQIGSYRSAPFGGKKNDKAGWGALVQNDREFTDWRLNVNAQISVHLLNDSIKRLSIGGAVGIINVGSSYDEVPVFNPVGDEMIQNNNLTELDAGFGIDFHYTNPVWELDLGAAAFQLPKTLLSAQQPGMFLVPHLLANAGAKFKTPDSVFAIQPLLLYKMVFGDTLAKSIGNGFLDAALKVEFPNKHFFVTGMYRFGNSALGAGFGVELFDRSDSMARRELTLSGLVEYPLNDSRLFGSKLELGLTLLFGQRYRAKDVVYVYDTIRIERGEFWKNTSNVNYYWDDKMTSNPDDLIGTVEHQPDKVILDYEFDDDVEQYNLDDYEEVGELIRHIQDNVLVEAFTPENSTWKILKEVDYIALSAKMRFDTTAAQNPSRTLYDSDFGKEFSVTFDYDELPYTVKLKEGQLVNNLELTLLKLLSIRSRIARSLKIPEDEISIRINSDNPNLGTYQRTRITIGFLK